ncbi:hypothetical protein P7K49_007511 [Saguinus oedipus]|nr:hypothetical protein P7K49_007511 [Saguinus oedipus]
MSCRMHVPVKSPTRSLFQIFPDIDDEGNTIIGSTQYSLLIPDPWDNRWKSPQKAALYEYIDTRYPSSHLYIWREYFLQRRFQELTQVTIHQMLLQPYEQVLEADLSPDTRTP